MSSSKLLKRLIREYEKTVVEKFLLENGGNRTRTAEVLGISRRSLQNKLKLHASLPGGEPHLAENPAQLTIEELGIDL